MTASTDTKPLSDFQIGSIKAYRREVHNALGKPAVEEVANQILAFTSDVIGNHTLNAAQVGAIAAVVAVSMGHTIQSDPKCPLNREAFRVAFLSTIDSIMGNMVIVPTNGTETVQ